MCGARSMLKHRLMLAAFVLLNVSPDGVAIALLGVVFEGGYRIGVYAGLFRPGLEWFFVLSLLAIAVLLFLYRLILLFKAKGGFRGPS